MRQVGSLLARLAGWGAIAGAILWPVALAVLADAVRLMQIEPVEPMPTVGSPGSLLAPPVFLFAAAVAALELRATTAIGLADLVGDLSIAVAGVVFLLPSLLVSVVPLPDGLLGPGLLMLLVGSVIFGVAGLDGKRRPRWGSALIGSGAGGLLASIVAIGALGPDQLESVTATGLLSLLLYSAGWAWLGVHLALARPLTLAVRGPGERPG